MNNLYKRYLLFSLGCIPIRLAIVYVAAYISIGYLPLLGYISLLPAICFIYLFLSGTRTIGSETFGKPIWWNRLRPVHALLYILFAYAAIHKQPHGWKYLLVDVIMGLIAFFIYHVYYYV